ncbi:anaerobic ribonucleoside-triphosphate reductase activating protein [bacterium]|nr:anaerobic ribonucleoside-triphosphate reductase activating protein [bacterium]
MLLFLIGGIQKTSLIDYPKKIASIVFTQGCNFRCGYCHNPELLSFDSNNVRYDIPDFLSFLKTRIGKIDGVVITGGEPTLQSDLYNSIKEIKSLGFSVKLDTNGSNPQYLEQLISENLIDYIAMDIKAPLEKYKLITNVEVDTKNIQSSITMIMNSQIDYEFRTTVLKSLLSFQDFEEIGKLVCNAERYYIQKFVCSKIYDNNLKDKNNYSNSEFKEICNILQKYVKTVQLR